VARASGGGAGHDTMSRAGAALNVGTAASGESAAGPPRWSCGAPPLLAALLAGLVMLGLARLASEQSWAGSATLLRGPGQPLAPTLALAPPLSSLPPREHRRAHEPPLTQPQILVLMCEADYGADLERANGTALPLVFLAQAYADALRARRGVSATVHLRSVEEHARLSAPGQPLELGLVTFLRGRSLRPWQESEPGAPRDEVRTGYPVCSKTVPALRAALEARRVSRRLVVVVPGGEVFYARSMHCSSFGAAESYDVLLDRAGGGVVTPAERGCAVVPYVLGAEYQARQARYAANLRRLCEDGPRAREPLSLRAPDDVAILATVSLIKRSLHSAEAFVRSAMFGLLAELLGPARVAGTHFVEELNEAPAGATRYRRIVCEGDDLDAALCKSRFLFSIDMDNASLEGYITEKLFTGLIAGTVPIYFGAPDVARWVNPRRIIHCSLNATVLAALRAQKQGRSFPQLQERLQREPAKFELFAFFREFLRPHLASCVDRVVAVLNDPDEYARMVREPPFTDMDRVCKQRPFIHFDTGAQVFQVLHDHFGTPLPAGQSTR
jgi:hypothetical protein